MSSCQYRRGACILATRHSSHMLQGERGPRGGDNLQPACSNCVRTRTRTHAHTRRSGLLHVRKEISYTFVHADVENYLQAHGCFSEQGSGHASTQRHMPRIMHAYMLYILLYITLTRCIDRCVPLLSTMTTSTGSFPQ